MHEVIGGEFPIGNELLQRRYMTVPGDMMFSSGRDALFTILKNEKMGGGIILVPDYVCDSITRTIKDAGWKYKFYNVSEDLYVDGKSLGKSKADAILLINYFGMIELDNTIAEIKSLNADIAVIEDDVQAFYEYEKTKADYSFTSLRKWFPCPDGAFISSKRVLNSSKRKESRWSQYKLAGNILKNYRENVDDSISLELLQKGENLLESEYDSECSEVSSVIFSNIDLDDVAEPRKRNAKYLHEGLVELGVRHLYRDDAVPLFVPIFVSNRDSLRKVFFRNSIFTPIHWPRISRELNGGNNLYDTELSLICDQRYDLEDMERQIVILKQYFKK